MTRISICQVHQFRGGGQCKAKLINIYYNYVSVPVKFLSIKCFFMGTHFIRGLRKLHKWKTWQVLVFHSGLIDQSSPESNICKLKCKLLFNAVKSDSITR